MWLTLKRSDTKNKPNFWDNVRKTRGCWHWIGRVQGRGGVKEYGSFGKHNVRRVSYEIAFGKPPKGMRISYECKNRLCVNPAHLILLGRDLSTLKGRPKKGKFNFWDNVRKTRGCWYWTGARSHHSRSKLHRYGRFGKNKAHRISYELKFGKIPKGMCVLHKCDNPPCVNPKHLFLGTRRDNAHDMIKKGRGARLVGSKSPNAILNNKIVGKIRRKYSSGIMPKQISEELDVKLCTVHSVCYRKTWRHLL